MLNYQKFVDKYLDVLKEEILTNYKGEIIKTIYVGGGTPSTLSVLQLKKLFNILNNINIDSECEITFEMNVESTTTSKLELMYEFGVNRLSFGVQTFNEDMLKSINRHHTSIEVKEMIKSAKEIGFDNINVDLMFNLPSQTISDLQQDLEQFLSLEVNHISIYSLILEEKSVFGRKNVDVNYDDFEECYYLIKEHLEDKGYVHYETSNFSKKGFESKHNLVYWNCENYYGFGLGSSSYIDKTRCENTASITKYLNNHLEKECQELTKIDLMQEFMFLGLRKIEGISISEFTKKFEENVFEVFDFNEIDDDLIIVTDTTIKLSKEGLIRANDVLINFV